MTTQQEEKIKIDFLALMRAGSSINVFNWERTADWFLARFREMEGEGTLSFQNPDGTLSKIADMEKPKLEICGTIVSSGTGIKDGHACFNKKPCPIHEPKRASPAYYDSRTPEERERDDNTTITTATANSPKISSKLAAELSQCCSVPGPVVHLFNPRQEKEKCEHEWKYNKSPDSVEYEYCPKCRNIREFERVEDNKESWWGSEFDRRWNFNGEFQNKPLLSSIKSFIRQVEDRARTEVIDKIIKIVENVSFLNDSNGRYNACREIIQALNELKQ